MGRRSFFFKNYVTHLVLIVCAFAAAGSVFYYQMSNYALSSKQAELRTTVQSLAEQTKLIQGTDSDIIREIYMLSIGRVAKEDAITVCVTDADGVIQMIAAPDGTAAKVDGYIMPSSVIQQVRNTGSYAEVGQLGVIGDRSSYTVGTGVQDDNGELSSMVFVYTQDATAAGVVRHSTQTLVLILLVTLVVALIISFILSQHMTRPLKAIAAAAKEFAAGNFEVRVPEDNRCYEIDELAVSFNNMARDLDQLEELTRGFISNVSHEFKTPMTTIGGFVDGMIDGTIPADQRDKYLHIIAEETRRLSRMVGRMLDAAKIQSGELLINPAPMDFSAMTTQILLSFEQKIEKKQLDVCCELDDRLIVMGDRDHLYRAVYNLVDNAVKFINEGGRLCLRAHPEGEFCAFSISNTGTGISSDDLPHIFDRFYKADRSRSMDKTGAGLGLYIVKNIINLHGGEISVRSDGGETEFEFTLPLAPPQLPNAKQQ
ncbi:MAG TPA: HAMP domain-containing histidine kinase [Candidatus Agathobaculum stercoravium]|nr:HAMP domain-containing sensor histidine kinase [uncultured Agathobaculum sp.]HIV97437.1 HAMP domain-containing histidine kinase [Candidatus Agathobaculum stercoravium]